MEGERAPEFCLPDAEGKEHCLEDFRGKWVVLYFYPRDSTSGCTREAVAFTEMKKDFENEGAVIIGISKDSPGSHARFIEKHGLDILLLSDKDHSVIEKFGAWGKKKLYGKEHWGTGRSTFLIDPQGSIIREWKKVKVNEHAQNVLDTLKEVKE